MPAPAAGCPVGGLQITPSLQARRTRSGANGAGWAAADQELSMATHAAVSLAMAAMQADASPALAAPIVAAFARLGAMASTVTA